MRARVALILTILGLAMAVIAAPVAAGGGSAVITIGNAGGDGEISGGFVSFDATTWNTSAFCPTGFAFTPEPPSPEFRFALEFPLSGLPANATITGATLSVAVLATSSDAQATSVYGYAGDGAVTDVDVLVSGLPATFLNVTSVPADHDVTSLMTAAMVNAGWAGFSFRDLAGQPTLYFWDCPTAGDNGDNFPILTIAYDLPNPPTPVASNLPNAALPEPGPSSPLATLGFAILLIGALGTLALVSGRRATRGR